MNVLWMNRCFIFVTLVGTLLRIYLYRGKKHLSFSGLKIFHDYIFNFVSFTAATVRLHMLGFFYCFVLLYLLLVVNIYHLEDGWYAQIKIKRCNFCFDCLYKKVERCLQYQKYLVYVRAVCFIKIFKLIWKSLNSELVIH